MYLLQKVLLVVLMDQIKGELFVLRKSKVRVSEGFGVDFFFFRSQLGMNRIKELINQQIQQILSLVEHVPSKLATEKKVPLFELIKECATAFLGLQCERKRNS